jgi:hypothetical protein
MRSESISEIIRYASILSVVLPLIVYFTKIKHASRAVHLIGAALVISAISDMVGYVLFAGGKSTVILFNGYYAVQFLLLTWFYYEVLPSDKAKSIVIGGLVTYALAFALITVFIQPLSEYQNYLWTITGMIMIVYGIAYFVNLFASEPNHGNHWVLWINSGILFYFSFNLFVFFMSKYVLTKLEPEVSLLVWSFHNVNNILKNILVAFGVAAFGKITAEEVNRALADIHKRRLVS